MSQSIAPPPGLSFTQARNWLSNLHTMLDLSQFKSIPGKQDRTLVSNVAELLPARDKRLLLKSNPSTDINHLAIAMTAWFQKNNLLEVVDDYGKKVWHLTLSGRALTMTSANKRKALPDAWKEVAQFLTRVAWNNAAPALSLPYEIHDVLLFGSLTDPKRSDFGDADLMLIITPKGQTKEERDTNWRASCILGLNLPHSLRGKYVCEWESMTARFLRCGRDFLSMSRRTEQAQYFEEMGKPISCVSLLGKKWTDESLQSAGQSERDTPALLRALNLAENSNQQQIAQDQLQLACKKLGLPQLKNLLSTPNLALAAVAQSDLSDLAKHAVKPIFSRVMTRLSKDLATTTAAYPPDDAARAMWWASAQPCGIEVALTVAQFQNQAAASTASAATRFFEESCPLLSKEWEKQKHFWQATNVTQMYSTIQARRQKNQKPMASISIQAPLQP